MLFLHFYGFLKLKPASGRYSQHLEIIICRLHNVAWCLQRVATNICKLRGLCHILKPTCAICLGPATLWSNMCTWKSARSILELGLRFFLPAVLLPSFLPSLPPSFFPFLLSGLCPAFFFCWVPILIPFSFDKFALGSRCKCSMQQVCQLLWWGEPPTALVAAWTEGMSAVASFEASQPVRKLLHNIRQHLSVPPLQLKPANARSSSHRHPRRCRHRHGPTHHHRHRYRYRHHHHHHHQDTIETSDATETSSTHQPLKTTWCMAQPTDHQHNRANTTNTTPPRYNQDTVNTLNQHGQPLRHHGDTTETPPRHHRDATKTPPRHRRRQRRDTTETLSETSPRQYRDTTETPPRHHRVRYTTETGDTTETPPRHHRDTAQAGRRKPDGAHSAFRVNNPKLSLLGK